MSVASIQVDPKSANPFTAGIPQLVLQNGTNFPVSGYAFDATTSEQIFLEFKIPLYLSGNITVTLKWYSDTGQTTNAVVWGVQIAAITAGDAQSMLTDALATTQTTTTTVNGTARGPTQTVVTVTNLDSAAADDSVTMRIYRDAAAGGDTMTGDAVLYEIEVEYTATGGTGASVVEIAPAAIGAAVTTMQVVTGMAITLPVAGTYYIEGAMSAALVATATLTYAFNVSANLTRMMIAWQNDLTATADATGVQAASVAVAAAGTAGFASGSKTVLTTTPVWFSGTIVVSGSATIQVLASRSVSTLTLGGGMAAIAQ